MTSYDITKEQKQLLKLLVKNIKAKKITEPIIPEICSNSYSIEGIDKKFGRNFIWDMEALGEAGLMEFTYNRYSSQGNRIFTITRAGYQAVENNFVFAMPEEPETAPDSLEVMLGEINIGKIQAVWFANLSEIHHIVNDKSLLAETLEVLTNQLLEAIEPEISAYKLTSYKRNIRDLKAQITADDPSPSTLQRLFASLSFMESMGDSIVLAEKALPYLYPLLVIANRKISG